MIKNEINAQDNPVEYLNATVWAKIAPSKIHGVGVFAIRDIKKGTLVTDWFRSMRFLPFVFSFKESDFLKLKKPIQDLILDKTLFSCCNYILEFISPNYECYLQDFTNHSNIPNVDTDYIALRDIKTGEEILEDYSSFKLQGGKAHHLIIEHLKDICKL